MFADNTDTQTKGGSTSSSGAILAKKGKRLTLDIDSERHRRLRMAALSEDVYAREILIEALDDWLKKKNY